MANDTQPNKLYRNRGDRTFQEVGVQAGLAFSEDGRARAGMGTDAADFDNSGAPSLVVTNFSGEMLGLYSPVRPGVYADRAPGSELGKATRLTLGFGCFFFDADLDGLLDLLVVNGHIDDRVATTGRVNYAETPHLFHNRGKGRLVDIARDLGAGFAAPKVGRGAAYGDIDLDGDLDVLITTNGGPAALYRNDTGPDKHSLRLTYALRQIRKSPGFAAAAIVTLALGIGAAAAMFGLIEGVLLSPPPYAAPDRLVLVSPKRVDGQPYTQGTWFAQWLLWRAESKTLDTPALYRWTFNFLVLPDGSRSLGGMVVTRNFFSTIGVKPLHGREFTEAEASRPKVPATGIMLGYELWQQQFKGDPAVVGSSIHISRFPTPLTVVGVMPPGIRFLPDPRTPANRTTTSTHRWTSGFRSRPTRPSPGRAAGTRWPGCATAQRSRRRRANSRRLRSARARPIPIWRSSPPPSGRSPRC